MRVIEGACRIGATHFNPYLAGEVSDDEELSGTDEHDGQRELPPGGQPHNDAAHEPGERGDEGGESFLCERGDRSGSEEGGAGRTSGAS